MDLLMVRVRKMEPVMKHVFGPVRSRRLGRSLGIDPLPVKTCNWNCVYCQLGRTRPLTNARRTFFPCDELLAGGRVQVVVRYGVSYWSVAEATYAPEGTRDPVGRPTPAKRPGRDRLSTSDTRTNQS